MKIKITIHADIPCDNFDEVKEFVECEIHDEPIPEENELEFAFLERYIETVKVEKETG